MAEASEALLDPSSKVVDIKYDTRVDLAWENVRYSVATGKDTPDKIILKGLTGNLGTGKLLAILGPSGSGKTSLLNCLAGRIPVTDGASLTGTVWLNGDSTVDMSQHSAYIEQDDALFALSTVFETLMFAARLRLPASMSLEEKRSRVEALCPEPQS